MRFIAQNVVMLVVTLVAKKAFGRIRPSIPEGSMRMINLRSLESNCSFPSGDTAHASVIAFFIYFHFPYLSQALGDYSFIIKFIVMVAIGRVFYHCHFFGDTIFGAFLGFLVVAGFHYGGIDDIIVAG
jgi:membrane-associated phospholipid phosphatase